MSKFHINPDTGVVSRCRAAKGKCPHGGATGIENHFSTIQEARDSYENVMAKREVPKTVSKTRAESFMGEPAEYEQLALFDDTVKDDVKNLIGDTSKYKIEDRETGMKNLLNPAENVIDRPTYNKVRKDFEKNDVMNMFAATLSDGLQNGSIHPDELVDGKGSPRWGFVNSIQKAYEEETGVKEKNSAAIPEVVLQKVRDNLTGNVRPIPVADKSNTEHRRESYPSPSQPRMDLHGKPCPHGDVYGQCDRGACDEWFAFKD